MTEDELHRKRLFATPAAPDVGRAVVLAYMSGRKRLLGLGFFLGMLVVLGGVGVTVALEWPAWVVVVAFVVVAGAFAALKKRTETVSCPQCGTRMVATRFQHHKDRDGHVHRNPMRLNCDRCEMFVDLGDESLWPAR